MAKLIALLACDTLISEVVSEDGDYDVLYSNLLRSALPTGSQQEFKLDAYDVVRAKDYPSDEELGTYNAILISGSGPRCLRFVICRR